MSPSRLVVGLTLMTLISTSAVAAQFYRWVDKQGRVYVQSYIPPEFVAGGYEIIDENNNILKQVAPQITEEERLANESAAVSKEMQRARDEELLKFYRLPTDVDRAMGTWLSRMDMEIRVKESRIRIKENEYDGLQKQAADQERAGQQVSEELTKQMAEVLAEIDGYRQEIAEIDQRRAESRAEFMRDRQRMIELYEMLHNEPWVEPETESK